MEDKTKERLRTYRERLKKYFSGKLAMIQITAGIGAFIGRTIAIIATDDQSAWIIAAASITASTVGYISLYCLGYWWAFRNDYRESKRSMIRDVFGLQIIEQMPNLATLVVAVPAQAAIFAWFPVPDWIGANLASWFGPQKIVNLLAMVTSNSTKKAWIDGTWSPIAGIRAVYDKIINIGKKTRNKSSPA